MEDVVVVTMSEFGHPRRKRKRGTDHGHANCMFVMGGPVKGGKVYGQVAGARSGQLNKARLALTTIFRSVLGEVIGGHLGSGIFTLSSRALTIAPRNSRAS